MLRPVDFTIIFLMRICIIVPLEIIRKVEWNVNFICKYLRFCLKIYKIQLRQGLRHQVTNTKTANSKNIVSGHQIHTQSVLCPQKVFNLLKLSISPKMSSGRHY